MCGDEDSVSSRTRGWTRKMGFRQLPETLRSAARSQENRRNNELPRFALVAENLAATLIRHTARRRGTENLFQLTKEGSVQEDVGQAPVANCYRETI